MKLTVLLLTLLLAATACRDKKAAEGKDTKAAAEKDTVKLEGPDFTWFEIPVANLDRATTFYSKVFGTQLKPTEMGEGKEKVTLVFLPAFEKKGMSGALLLDQRQKPAANGTLLYLNGGKDLQPMLDRAKAAGGKVLVPKTEINKELGHFAVFQDTEGNTVALHSSDRNAPEKNDLSWFELDMEDYARGKRFYEKLIGKKFEEQDMNGRKMAFFPNAMTHFSGALVEDKMMKPAVDGPTVFLNSRGRIDEMLKTATAEGGKVLVPKTKLPENYGYFAVILDTEGNRVGLQGTN